jgi:hypothetical protein
VEIFEVIAKKRNLSDGCFPNKYGISRNKAHHCYIEVAKMIGQENIGLPFFNYAFNLDFDRKKNE